jgi:hypothetical protein
MYALPKNNGSRGVALPDRNPLREVLNMSSLLDQKRADLAVLIDKLSSSRPFESVDLSKQVQDLVVQIQLEEQREYLGQLKQEDKPVGA